MKKIKIMFLVMLTTCISVFASEKTESYYQLGHEALLNQDILLAKAMFDKAVKENSKSSEAKVMSAFTKIVAPFQNKTFLSLVRSMGYPLENENLFNFELGERGRPQDDWRSQEGIDYLKNSVLPEILEAIKILDGVSPSMERMVIKTDEISIFGFDVYDSEVFYIEYADVEFIKGVANAVAGAIYFATAYNFDLVPSFLWDCSENNENLSVQMVLGSYPELLTLKEKGDLAKSKKSLLTASNLLKNSIENIAERNLGDSYVFSVNQEEVYTAKSYIDKFVSLLNGNTISYPTSFGYNFDINIKPLFDGKLQRSNVPSFHYNKIILDSITDFTFAGVLKNFDKDTVKYILENYDTCYVIERSSSAKALEYPLMRYGITGVDAISYDAKKNRYLFETKVAYTEDDKNSDSDVYLLDGKTGDIKMLSKGMKGGATLSTQKKISYNGDCYYAPIQTANSNCIGGNYAVMLRDDPNAMSLSYEALSKPETVEIRSDEYKELEIPLKSYNGNSKYVYKVRVEIEYDCKKINSNYDSSYGWLYESEFYYKEHSDYIYPMYYGGSPDSAKNSVIYEMSYVPSGMKIQVGGNNSKITIKSVKVHIVPNKEVVLVDTETLKTKVIVIDGDHSDGIYHSFKDCGISPNGKYVFLAREFMDMSGEIEIDIYDVEKDEYSSGFWWIYGYYNSEASIRFSNDSEKLLVGAHVINLQDQSSPFDGYDYLHSIDCNGTKGLSIEYIYDDWSGVPLFPILKILDPKTDQRERIYLDPNPYQEFSEFITLTPDGDNILYIAEEDGNLWWFNYNISSKKTTRLVDLPSEILNDYSWYDIYGWGKDCIEVLQVDESGKIYLFGNVDKMFATAASIPEKTLVVIDTKALQKTPAYMGTSSVALKGNATNAKLDIANGNGEYKILVRDVLEPSIRKVYSQSLAKAKTTVSLDMPSSTSQAYVVDLLSTSSNTPVGFSSTAYVGRTLPKTISITKYPKDVVVAETEKAVFSVTAKAGSGKLSYSWEKSTNGKDWNFAGSTKASLTVNGVKIADDNTTYRCKISDNAETKYVYANLYVLDAPAEYKIIGNYENLPVAKYWEEDNFVDMSTNAPDGAEVQWQINIDNKWVNVYNSEEYYWEDNWEYNKLRVYRTLENSGSEYRAIVKNQDGNVIITDPVTVTMDTSKVIYYVSPDGDDNNDGKSWETAFKTFNAINSDYPAIVYVKSGKYEIDDFWIESCSIYGGFNGTEKSLEDRKLDGKNPTILQIKNSLTANVLNGVHLISTDIDDHCCVYVSEGDRFVKIENCYFENLYLISETRSLTFVKNSTFNNTRIPSYLGDQGYMVYKNCTFVNSDAIYFSGYSESSGYSTLDIFNCTFYNINNTQFNEGCYSEHSMLQIRGPVNANIVNSIFWNNNGSEASICVGDSYYYETSRNTNVNISNCVLQGEIIQHLPDYYDDPYYYYWNYEGPVVKTTSIVKKDPRCKELADNGGYVKTVAIDEYSSAIGAAISPASANIVGWGLPEDDARGIERDLSISSIGAYEFPAGIIFDENLPSEIECSSGVSTSLKVDARDFKGRSLKYVWYVNKQDNKGFVKISGKANVLTVKPTVKMNGYQYKCEVIAGDNHKFSSPATLIVFGKPIIKTAPKNLTVYEGKTAVFEVSAYGNELEYQWYKDGVLIADNETAKTNKLELNNVDSSAKYTCKISSGGYSVESKAVKLSVNAAVRITGYTVMQNKKACAVEDDKFIAYSEYPLELNVIASPTKGAVYQWYECSSREDPGVPISKATKAKLSIKELEYDENFVERYYKCVVKNGTKKLEYTDGTSAEICVCVRVEKCPMPATLAGKALRVVYQESNDEWFDEQGDSLFVISQDAKQIRMVNLEYRYGIDVFSQSTYSYKRKSPTEADFSVTFVHQEVDDEEIETEKGTYKGVLKYDEEEKKMFGTLKYKKESVDVELFLYEDDNTIAPKQLSSKNSFTFVDEYPLDFGGFEQVEWATLDIVDSKKCNLTIDENRKFGVTYKYTWKSDKVAILTFSYKDGKTTITNEITLYFNEEDEAKGLYIRKTAIGKSVPSIQYGSFMK